MIIVKLQGGLGNQMFQYALGRHLEHRHDVPLRFDERAAVEGKWPLALGDFELEYEAATPSDVEQVVPLGETGLRIAHKLSFDASGLAQAVFNFYKERSREPAWWAPFAVYKWHFDPRVLDAGPDAYLEGYWQSRKYFEPVEDELRADFTIATPLEGKNREVAEQIDDVTAVSLHARRGDYERRGFALPAEYYPAAIERIRQDVEDPHLFVFSDDPDWVREAVDPDLPTTYVEHNDAETAIEDVRLMSRCDHHVVANSTFSWWGAWLNDDPEKTVVAPVLWHSLVNVLEAELDVIPEHWEIVEW